MAVGYLRSCHLDGRARRESQSQDPRLPSDLGLQRCYEPFEGGVPTLYHSCARYIWIYLGTRGGEGNGDRSEGFGWCTASSGEPRLYQRDCYRPALMPLLVWLRRITANYVPGLHASIYKEGDPGSPAPFFTFSYNPTYYPTSSLLPKSLR